MNKLYVRTKAQKAIFEKELQGQLSDGFWENENTDKRLWDCRVIVARGDNKLGCNFSPRRYRVDFCEDDLIECVGDRMISYASEFRKNYTEKSLTADLQELTKIVFG